MNGSHISRHASVKRWIIVNTSRQQTLAEHLWTSTMLAIEICDRLKVALTPADIKYLLTHDSHEIFYGDIPTPGKDLIKRYSVSVDIFDDINNDLSIDAPSSGVPIYIKRVKDLADKLEAAVFIKDHAVGPHAKIVAYKQRESLNRMLVGCEPDVKKVVEQIYFEMAFPESKD